MATMILEILDDEFDTFVEKDWIKAGRKYGQHLPFLIHEAKQAVLAIPTTFLDKAALPRPETVIAEFINHDLPLISSQTITTKPSKWFSHDIPKFNLDLLLTRPVPTTKFVAELEESFGQEWFDGARSIVDHRFNDGPDRRLPLWIISFWRRVIRLQEIQNLWNRAWKWLEVQKKEMNLRSGEDSHMVAVLLATHLLETLSWGIKMPHCRNTVDIWVLARFLGTLWMTDEHISMMIEELVKDVDATANLKLEVRLADVHFSIEIGNIDSKLALPPFARQKTLIYHLENDIKKNGIKKLYFPLHVKGNHWIAGEIDFKQETISFGDSLARGTMGAPPKFVNSLQTWLQSSFGKHFRNRDNVLPHAVQDDRCSCGIITLNTLEHALFNKPLWTSKGSVDERLGWFIRLASACTTRPTAEPTSHGP